MHHGISFGALQRAFLIGGLIALAADCWMVAIFGSSMSMLHAIVLCAATAFAAGVWPAVLYMKEAGAGRVVLGLMAVLGCLATGGALFSDIGYTVGLRSLSTTEAHMQTTAYKARQEQAGDTTKLFQSAVEEANSIRHDHPDVVTTNISDGQAAIDAAHLKIDLEAKRGGCGPICLKDKQELAGLEDRIATARHYAELQKTISDNRAHADKATDVAVNTKVGMSWVEAQSDYLPQLASAIFGGSTDEVLNPSEVARKTSNIWIAIVVAFVMTFIPEGAIFVGTWGIRGSAPHPASFPSAAAKPQSPKPGQPAVANDHGLAFSKMGFATLPTQPNVLMTSASEVINGLKSGAFPAFVHAAKAS